MNVWPDYSFEKKEYLDLLFISLILGSMFAISQQRFVQTSLSVLESLIVNILFVFVLLCSRLAFMKYFSLKEGFALTLHQTFINRFWFRKFDTLSHGMKDSFKGIPTVFASVFVYLLSAGYYIFVGTYRFSKKRIPHLHFGTKRKYEHRMGFMINQEISDLRFTRVFFMGSMFYLLVAIIMKILLPSELFVSWFLFIVFWFGLTGLFPIIGTEGFDFWLRNKFGWTSAFVILLVGLISLLVIENTLFSLLFLALSSILMMGYVFYNHVRKL